VGGISGMGKGKILYPIKELENLHQKKHTPLYAEGVLKGYKGALGEFV